MTHLTSHRLLKALRRQPVDRPPVWLMRQAGRYLPEYRQLRQQAGSFMALCTNPELACEVTLQPLRRFDLDAAILFSDILTIPDAMGLGLNFIAGDGPVFQRAIRSSADVNKLFVPDPDQSLRYVTDAIRLIKKTLNDQPLADQRPLIGFSGSPWTLATYMIEGRSNRQFDQTRAMMAEQPQLLHQLLEILTLSVTDYLNAQIEAGVDVVMLFDTWGSILMPDHFMTYSLQYMQKIIASLHQTDCVPTILFARQSGSCLELIANSGCSAVGIDWTVDLAEAKQRVSHQVALQGNLDPAILKQSPAMIEQAVNKILQVFDRQPGYIFNLGHGMTPDIPPQHVNHLINSIHHYYDIG